MDWISLLEPFDTPTAINLSGVPRGTLDGWERSGLVKASVSTGKGRGYGRKWLLNDILIAHVVLALRNFGVKPASIKSLMSRKYVKARLDLNFERAGSARTGVQRPVVTIAGQKHDKINFYTHTEISNMINQAVAPFIVFHLDNCRVKWFNDVRPTLARRFARSKGLAGKEADKLVRELLGWPAP